MVSKRKTKEQYIENILLENYDHYYRMAYSYTHNEADAQDVVQNGVVKAILYSDSLKNTEVAKAWIYRIMLNETFDLLKRRKETSLDEVIVEPVQEDIYQDFDLQRVLNSMSKEDKAVIELRYFEDLKLFEIAEILNENVSTVKSRLYRGLKKLRMELSDAWEMES